MSAWKTRERRTVLTQNPFLRVELHTVELPDGRVVPDWSWLAMPDYANVLARTRDGRFLCFRQQKYAVAGLQTGPPGGYLEPGEDPLAGAQRELAEETGYAAAHWYPLGSYTVDANRGAGTAHFFLALDAEFRGRLASDDLEEQQLLLLTRAELEQALAENQVRLLPWLAAIVLGLRALDRLEAGTPS